MSLLYCLNFAKKVKGNYVFLYLMLWEKGNDEESSWTVFFSSGNSFYSQLDFYVYGCCL
jgi:hypothetical protein